jgi:Spy/CpxP family protein refolding chaperone
VVAAALLGLATVASAQAPGGNPSPDWRQHMIARGSSTVSVDQALANLTKNLGLTPDQVAKIRPILQAHHDRILAILKSAPQSMTHDEFTAQVHAISAQTHDEVNALLTPSQLELVKTLGTPARTN